MVRETIEKEYKGEPIAIGFYGQYLLDFRIAAGHLRAALTRVPSMTWRSPSHDFPDDCEKVNPLAAPRPRVSAPVAPRRLVVGPFLNRIALALAAPPRRCVCMVAWGSRNVQQP